MYVYVYFYPTWDSDPNRLSCFSWGLKAGTKGKWPCAVQAVPFLVAVLASWFKKQRKIRDSLDKIPCTHQPRPQQAAPRGWATCQPKPPPRPQLLWLQPLQQRPMWSRWIPIASPKAEQSCVDPWLMMVDDCRACRVVLIEVGNSCQKLVGFGGSQKMSWAKLMSGKHCLRPEETGRMALFASQAFGFLVAQNPMVNHHLPIRFTLW